MRATTVGLGHLRARVQELAEYTGDPRRELWRLWPEAMGDVGRQPPYTTEAVTGPAASSVAEWAKSTPRAGA